MCGEAPTDCFTQERKKMGEREKWGRWVGDKQNKNFLKKIKKKWKKGGCGGVERSEGSVRQCGWP
jgi:hypothetical protein